MYINLLTNNSRLQVNKYRSWNVFPGTGFTEERVKRVVSSSYSFITWHLAVRLDSVLKTVELPTSVTHLDAGLSSMYGDTFTLYRQKLNPLGKERLLTVARVKR